MERRCHEVLDAAHDGGVRYLDAARSYGRAEAFLASWLDRRGVPPDGVTVGSKWGYVYVGDWRMDADVQEVKDHTVGTLRRQVGESRALLGDRLRLYQIHSATLDGGVLEDRAVLSELLRLLDDGLAVGLSLSGPDQAGALRRAMEVDVGGRNPFQTVQATWNLLEPSAGPALAEAHREGWGVIVKEAMANGRLVDADDPRLETLRAVATRVGATPDAVALAGALANTWADVVLSGAATARQLRSNLAAEQVVLTEDDLDRLGSLAEPAEAYWTGRSARPWV